VRKKPLTVAVIGADGYLGAHLCRRLEAEDDIRKVLRYDARVYRQRGHEDTVVTRSPYVIAQQMEMADGPPSSVTDVVWLGAYAHDPHNKIPDRVVSENNAARPAVLQEWCVIHNINFYAVSSLSVFSFGSYPRSKLKLEELLSNDRLHTNIFRFGTLFGEPATIDSYRSHLVLNRMVFDAIQTGDIKVFGADLSRPVLPVYMASNVIRESILSDRPKGEVTNHYLTSGKLIDFAKLISKLLTQRGLKARIIRSGIVDKRDYTWGEPDLDRLLPWLHGLIHYTENNLGEIERGFKAFPDNLYDYIARTE